MTTFDTSLLADLPGHPEIRYVSLAAGEKLGLCQASKLPFTLKILAECALRLGGDARALTPAGRPRSGTVEFRPSRLLLQDFTGLPLMTDLASLRDELAERGCDPTLVNPRLPVDFVCDHALIAVHGGRDDARTLNERIEIERNRERFEFLKWCGAAFDNVRVIPPGSGIMHQLNLEWLSTVVRIETIAGQRIAMPDTLLGTDSHTTMVNGLGVLGWGVGGLEAQAAMLGHPALITAPRVVGLRLSGAVRPGVTSTDLVLRVAEVLRNFGVIGQFVEAFGSAVAALGVETRSTIANMAPEYGATSVYFPLDGEALRYLRLTGRSSEQVALVEAYAKAQGLWRDEADAGDAALYDAVVDLDLATVVPAMAGPTRPDQYTPLAQVPATFAAAFPPRAAIEPPRSSGSAPKMLVDGDIVIAAITSCTNTSNPHAMLAAGLMARNARRRGLKPAPWVKTSFAPGSRVVADYLSAAGLTADLDAMGFQVIGFGCTTCNGNSGPLHEGLEQQIAERDIASVAVLSGNRNFEGRIHARVRAGYLCSPALVIAAAIAGSIHVDLSDDPLGFDAAGAPVRLADIWPSDEDIGGLLQVVTAERFRKAYVSGAEGHSGWSAIEAPSGVRYPWRADSTFVGRSPFAQALGGPGLGTSDAMTGFRALAILGDSINTDHLSPNGGILPDTPAARFLAERRVPAAEHGTYAARRGHHEIGVRSALANAHVRNEILGGERGSFTRLMPERQRMSIFDASQVYVERGIPTLIIAGRGYGSGSSRDWAAKGVRYLGVRAVVAQSFERIHRSNLIGVGVLPLTFPSGVDRRTLALTGDETFALVGLDDGLRVGGRLVLHIDRVDGEIDRVPVDLAVETAHEVAILRAGGLVPVLLGELTAPHMAA